MPGQPPFFFFFFAYRTFVTPPRHTVTLSLFFVPVQAIFSFFPGSIPFPSLFFSLGRPQPWMLPPSFSLSCRSNGFFPPPPAPDGTAYGSHFFLGRINRSLSFLFFFLSKVWRCKVFCFSLSFQARFSCHAGEGLPLFFFLPPLSMKAVEDSFFFSCAVQDSSPPGKTRCPFSFLCTGPDSGPLFSLSFEEMTSSLLRKGPFLFFIGATHLSFFFCPALLFFGYRDFPFFSLSPPACKRVCERDPFFLSWMLISFFAFLPPFFHGTVLASFLMAMTEHFLFFL